MDSPPIGVTITFDLVLLAIALSIYFLPTWIAWGRNHFNVLPIFVLNLLLGWTFVGWVLALVWACTNNVATQR